MRIAFAISLALSTCLLASTSFSSRVRKPPLPPGLDPGGPSIAILTPGLDYRLSRIASRLARDGEGELVGLDLIEGDNRPFLETRNDMPATAYAEIVTAVGEALRARLIPVRLKIEDRTMLRQAIAFISLTPARLVIVAGTDFPNDFADYFPADLIVVAIHLQSEAELPKNFQPGKVLVISRAEPLTVSRILSGLRDCPSDAVDGTTRAGQALRRLKQLLAEGRNDPVQSHDGGGCEAVRLFQRSLIH